jgi:uncharacterized protein with HEPN domain
MKQEKLYLAHILDASERLARYLPATIQELADNEMAQDAIIKNLANITESASNLEKVTQSAYPDIPWKQIKGMRNILVHNYLGDLSHEEIWRTVKEDLPILVKVVKIILKEKYNV